MTQEELKQLSETVALLFCAILWALVTWLTVINHKPTPDDHVQAAIKAEEIIEAE